MSYTAHTWEDRENITAARLNAIENALAAASPMIVECTNPNGNIWYPGTGAALNKTYREIYDALKAGTPVFIKWGIANDPSVSNPPMANASLIPVKVAYRYNDNFRIAVDWPAPFGQWGDVGDAFRSNVITFSVPDVSSYPVFAAFVAAVPED